MRVCPQCNSQFMGEVDRCPIDGCVLHEQADALIGRVIDLRASDIHLEPFDDGLHVRYRVDGALETTEVIPPRQGAAVASRVKLLAHLDIAERRVKLGLLLSTPPAHPNLETVLGLAAASGNPIAAIAMSHAGPAVSAPVTTSPRSRARIPGCRTSSR